MMHSEATKSTGTKRFSLSGNLDLAVLTVTSVRDNSIRYIIFETYQPDERAVIS